MNGTITTTEGVDFKPFRSGQVRVHLLQCPCWQSVSFISPCPFLSVPERQRPLRYVFFLTKFKSYCTHPNFDPNLTQPSSHFRFRSLSGHRAPFNSTLKKYSLDSGLGRKPEWDSNTLISLNSELPLSATRIGPPKFHPHPRKAQAASKPFSVCRSYMKCDHPPPHINCAVPSSEAAAANPGFFFFFFDERRRFISVVFSSNPINHITLL